MLTALWEGGQVTLERPGTLVREVAIHPLPLQRPYPPLWFAGSDPQAALLGRDARDEPRAGVQAVDRAGANGRGVSFRMSQATGRRSRAAGRIALMRQVSIAPTDLEALDAMTEDLDRLHRLGTGGPGDLDKARNAAERMIQEESFIAGSPETVARELLTAARAARYRCLPGQHSRRRSQRRSTGADDDVAGRTRSRRWSPTHRASFSRFEVAWPRPGPHFFRGPDHERTRCSAPQATSPGDVAWARSTGTVVSWALFVRSGFLGRVGAFLGRSLGDGLAGSLGLSGVEGLLGDLRIQTGDDLVFAGQNGDTFRKRRCRRRGSGRPRSAVPRNRPRCGPESHWEDRKPSARTSAG